ncbi:GGDEF domain-containing protein [Neiella sp. HB171785]|uniref:diguanylate cyclase n=1 Tax=Neiella litorisoli TaxID=2771431 RepID=A0A8J6R4B7_9GAMM|nr:GGDEF domain-containing protein [Neiella litorisoli]MBD1391375.1 GGDEF domain-containing protein [Neiella litorisoli]
MPEAVTKQPQHSVLKKAAIIALLVLFWIPIDGLTLLSLHSLERVLWSAEMGYMFALCLYFGWRGALLCLAASILSSAFWLNIDTGPVSTLMASLPVESSVLTAITSVTVIFAVTHVYHRFYGEINQRRTHVQVVPAFAAALLASFLVAYINLTGIAYFYDLQLKTLGLSPSMLAMAFFSGIVSLSALFCLLFDWLKLAGKLNWPVKLVLSRQSRPRNGSNYLLLLGGSTGTVIVLFYLGNQFQNDVWHMLAGLVIIASVMHISVRFSELQTAAAGAFLVSILAAMEHSVLGNSVNDSIEIFLPLLAITVYAQRLIPQMLLEQGRLRRKAESDPLTHLLNRRGFTAAANIELERANRYRRPLSLLILDIDHFKQVNDNHGHHSGDLVLKLMSRSLMRGLRSEAIAGRWGGEEFVAILPECDTAAAMICAERVRQLIAGEKAHFATGTVVVTASVGIAQMAVDEPLEQLIERADKALYEAKGQGRDRAVIASS